MGGRGREGVGGRERERERDGGREREREGGREGGRAGGREGGRGRERDALDNDLKWACTVIRIIVSCMSIVMSGVSVQWETKVEDGQKNFDKASKTLRKEVTRFEVVYIVLIATLFKICIFIFL